MHIYRNFLCKPKLILPIEQYEELYFADNLPLVRKRKRHVIILFASNNFNTTNVSYESTCGWD